MKPVLLLFCILLSACTGSIIETSLTQFSQGSSAGVFTERQSRDLSNLLKDLYRYTYHDESCYDVRNALETNETLYSLERAYDLNPSFIYDEFIEVGLTDTTTNPQDTEKSVFQSILAVWKQQATIEQIENIIFKVRRCYPQST